MSHTSTSRTRSGVRERRLRTLLVAFTAVLGVIGGSASAQSNPVTKVILTPSYDDDRVVGERHCFVGVAYGYANQYVEGALMTFSVTGVNPVSGSAMTYADGTAALCYFGTNPGDDQAVARVGTVVSNVARVHWLRRTEIVVNPLLLSASLADGVQPFAAMSARLTSDGDPVAGQLVYFAPGSAADMYLIHCYGTTDSNGVASCSEPMPLVSALYVGFYHASFIGHRMVYADAYGEAPLASVEDTPLP